MQDPKNRKKSPSGHPRTRLSDYIFATEARIDNRKKLFKQLYLPTRLHNIVNFGSVAAEIGSLVWGTPANFNGFRVLAALLRGTVVVGASQTFRRWTDGATYIRQGGHHVGNWPTLYWHIVMLYYIILLCYIILYCIVLYCTVLYCIILYYITLHYITLHYIILYLILFNFIYLFTYLFIYCENLHT